MSTILDQSVQLGVESTYGTVVTPTRAFEAQGDDFKRLHEYLDSVGMRAGMQGQRSDRRKLVNLGAEGKLSFDVLTKGFGLLLQGMLGTTTGPTQQGATAAYVSTHSTASADPAKSYTLQMQRVDVGDTLRAFNYKGSVITGWTLSQEVNGLLKAELDFDSRDEDGQSPAAASAVSPSAAVPFDWTDAVVTVNPAGGGAAEVCLKSFSLAAALGLKTDRRLMCSGGGLKRQPKRNSVPDMTGNLMAEFENLDEYNLFVNGTLCEVVATWTGAEIVSPHNYELKVTLPVVQFIGETPQSSLSEITMQPMPFRALHDGTNPMCTIEYKSTDTTL